MQQQRQFGGVFKYQDEFKNETKHTLQNSSHIHVLNSSANTKHFSSPDLCSQFSNIKKIKKKKVICINNPSLWAEFKPSEVNRGHGVVKRTIEERESSQMVTEEVTYKPEVGSQ